VGSKHSGCARTTRVATQHAYQSQNCFAGAQHLGGGGYCHELFPQLSPEQPTTPLTFRFTLSLSFPPQVQTTDSDPLRLLAPFTIFASHPTLRPQSEPPWHIPHIPSEDNATASHMADHVTDTKPCTCQTTASSGQLPSRSRPRGFQPLSASFYIIYSPFADAPFLLQDRLLVSSLSFPFRSRMYAHIVLCFGCHPHSILTPSLVTCIPVPCSDRIPVRAACLLGLYK